MVVCEGCVLFVWCVVIYGGVGFVVVVGVVMWSGVGLYCGMGVVGDVLEVVVVGGVVVVVL